MKKITIMRVERNMDASEQDFVLRVMGFVLKVTGGAAPERPDQVITTPINVPLSNTGSNLPTIAPNQNRDYVELSEVVTTHYR